MAARKALGHTVNTHTELAIRAESVTKRYGSRLALNCVTTNVAANTCTGIMGPNGAGKSTFTRLLYGRTARDSGSLSVLGLDPGRSSNAVRAQVGVVTQENFLDGDLNALDNLIVYGIYQGISSAQARRRAVECLAMFDLHDRAKARVAELSGGLQRRLALARAMMHHPRLLLLVEPTTGLDPVSRRDLWDILEGLTTNGRTILFSTHYLEEAERLCDEVVILDHGRALDQGSPAELVQRHLEQGSTRVQVPSANVGPEAAGATLNDLYLALFGRRSDASYEIKYGGSAE
jgi:lipooligosaccharide transport system ATP-binding protein